MIVACERCATQFQLDDSKVGGDGIRVRCSRCKHAFFVPAPGREPRAEDEVERLVRAAMEEAPPEPPPVPDVTRDLTEPRPPAPPSEALRDDGPSEGDSAFESDWQFNDDSSPDASFPASADAADAVGSEDPLEAARRAVDDLLAGAGDEAPAVASREAPEPPTPSPLAGAERTEPDAGAATRSAAEDAAEAESEADPDPGVDPDADPDLDWDFDFSADGAAPPREADARSDAAPTRPAPAVRSEVAPVMAGVETGPGRLAHWTRRGLDAAGWTAVLVLAAVALYGSLARPVGARWDPGVQQAAGVVIESSAGRWIENAAAGRLYVVSGTVRLSQALPAAPQQRPALRLVDDAGEPVPGALAPLGAPRSARELRERDPRTDPVAPLAAGPLGAGAARPFMAVFADVPARAAGWRLESVARAPRPPVAESVPSPLGDAAAADPGVAAATTAPDGTPAAGPSRTAPAADAAAPGAEAVAPPTR